VIDWNAICEDCFQHLKNGYPNSTIASKIPVNDEFDNINSVTLLSISISESLQMIDHISFGAKTPNDTTNEVLFFPTYKVVFCESNMVLSSGCYIFNGVAVEVMLWHHCVSPSSTSSNNSTSNSTMNLVPSSSPPLSPSKMPQMEPTDLPILPPQQYSYNSQFRNWANESITSDGILRDIVVHYVHLAHLSNPNNSTKFSLPHATQNHSIKSSSSPSSNLPPHFSLPLHVRIALTLSRITPYLPPQKERPSV